MQPDRPAANLLPFFLQFIAMTILGLAFAIIVGIIFSDESWVSFIWPGVIFGVSSTASVRKRHFPSLLIFSGGILGLLQTIRWPDAGWLSIAAGLLVVVGLLLWFLGSHRGSGASAG